MHSLGTNAEERLRGQLAAKYVESMFLHCRVFSYLDVVSLCRCACVSKYWHQIALDGSNWQRVDLFHYQTCVKVNISQVF